MAIEGKRGCGYRKIGGIYLVSDGVGTVCDRLPIRLNVCPTCGEGIKQSRGWTWIDFHALVGGSHYVESGFYTGTKGAPSVRMVDLCHEALHCALCGSTEEMKKAGLLWVGAGFYPNPIDFMREAKSQGISKRIKAIPRNFKLGETWVLLAHPKAYEGTPTFQNSNVLIHTQEHRMYPGIFYAFKPSRIEKIITESDAQDPTVIASLEKQGITAVPVPDDDPDHRGSVYDKPEKEFDFGEEQPPTPSNGKGEPREPIS